MSQFENECRALFEKHNRTGAFTWLDDEGNTQARLFADRQQRLGIAMDSQLALGKLRDRFVKSARPPRLEVVR